jgi:hypothetical protein
MQGSFFEVAGAVSKIGLSLKSNHHCQFSFAKSLKHTVWMKSRSKWNQEANKEMCKKMHYKNYLTFQLTVLRENNNIDSTYYLDTLDINGHLYY